MVFQNTLQKPGEGENFKNVLIRTETHSLLLQPLALHLVPWPWAALDSRVPESGQVAHDSFVPEHGQIAGSNSEWPLSEDH